MNVEQRQFLGYGKIIADCKPVSEIYEIQTAVLNSQTIMQEEHFAFKLEWKTK